MKKGQSSFWKISFLFLLALLLGAGGTYLFQSGKAARLISVIMGDEQDLVERVKPDGYAEQLSQESAKVTPPTDGVPALITTPVSPNQTTIVVSSPIPPEQQTTQTKIISPDPQPSLNAMQRAAALSPELAAAIENGRLLKNNTDAVTWGKNNLGYVGKSSPGDVIPGIDQGDDKPDSWVMGDEQTEGDGTDVPRYETVVGKTEFTEVGDLLVDGRPIKLSGVMLPGEGSNCKSGSGSDYDCVSWAVQGLKQYIEGKAASCSLTVLSGNSYGACDVMLSEDGKAVDLASWMVSAGIALAHDEPTTSIYRAQEGEAKSRKAGMWDGEFSIPGEPRE